MAVPSAGVSSVATVLRGQHHARAVKCGRPIRTPFSYDSRPDDTVDRLNSDRRSLYGPCAVQVLARIGAKDADAIFERGEWWRVVGCNWLHAGVFHLASNCIAIYNLGVGLEREHGGRRVGAVYLISGLVGTLSSLLFLPRVPTVGASGSVFGLIGAHWADLISRVLSCEFCDATASERAPCHTHLACMSQELWQSALRRLSRRRNAPAAAACSACNQTPFSCTGWALSACLLRRGGNSFAVFLPLLAFTSANLIFGFSPWVDNFVHLGGFFAGFFAALVIFAPPLRAGVVHGNARVASALVLALLLLVARDCAGSVEMRATLREACGEVCDVLNCVEPWLISSAPTGPSAATSAPLWSCCATAAPVQCEIWSTSAWVNVTCLLEGQLPLLRGCDPRLGARAECDPDGASADTICRQLCVCSSGQYRLYLDSSFVTAPRLEFHHPDPR